MILIQKIEVSVPKVFVRFSNFNELFQFIFNEYYDINFEHLPKPVVFIDDIHDIEITKRITTC